MRLQLQVGILLQQRGRWRQALLSYTFYEFFHGKTTAIKVFLRRKNDPLLVVFSFILTNSSFNVKPIFCKSKSTLLNPEQGPCTSKHA